MKDVPIPARVAPKDFPDGLPAKPPSDDEIYQLLEIWSNVSSINSLRGENLDGEIQSEYMLWTTNDHRQFRVIWDSDEEVVWTSEREKPL